MPLLSFSEPDHVAKLLDGRKQQTTRLQRKKPIEVGDTLYCYYKAQAKNTCWNCIHNITGLCNPVLEESCVEWKCNKHSNHFGKAFAAVVTPIQELIGGDADQETRESWAIADGFESWQAADEWFTKKYGTHWRNLPFVTIFFDACWLEDNCSECGHRIPDEDFEWDSQPVDDYRSEPIVVGYRCSNCGNEERV